VLGLKPTRGRVPYAGILGLDPTLDHVGVMSRTTAALADVFGVIAGHGQYWTDSATGRLHSLDGVTIGLLDEGFEPRSGIGRASVEALREPIGHLRAMGARLERVSLPRHHDGGEISRLLGLDAIATVIDSATGRDAGSTAWPALAAALGSGLRSRPGHLTPYAKLAAVVGWQLRRSDCGASVTAGRLGAQELMHDYDRLLERVDLVALPTTPTPARVLRDQLDPDRPLVDRLRLAWSNSVNTCQANLTGHPAINLPVAATDGLPVGLMLVAPTGGDDLLVRTAALYEREIGWTPRDPH
jgi:amidase